MKRLSLLSVLAFLTACGPVPDAVVGCDAGSVDAPDSGIDPNAPNVIRFAYEADEHVLGMTDVTLHFIVAGSNVINQPFNPMAPTHRVGGGYNGVETGVSIQEDFILARVSYRFQADGIGPTRGVYLALEVPNNRLRFSGRLFATDQYERMWLGEMVIVKGDPEPYLRFTRTRSCSLGFDARPDHVCVRTIIRDAL